MLSSSPSSWWLIAREGASMAQRRCSQMAFMMLMMVYGTSNGRSTAVRSTALLKTITEFACSGVLITKFQDSSSIKFCGTEYFCTTAAATSTSTTSKQQYYYLLLLLLLKYYEIRRTTTTTSIVLLLILVIIFTITFIIAKLLLMLVLHYY